MEEEKQWEEEEEEVVVLRGRRHRHQNNTTSTTATTSDDSSALILKADNETGTLNEKAEEEEDKEDSKKELNNSSNSNNNVVVDAAAGVAEIQETGEGEGRLTKSVYYDKDKGNETTFGVNLPPSGKSFEEQNTYFKPFNNGTKEHGDVNLQKGSEWEVTEFDVEKVLEKQDTHDLYCPNCNSCITRRVILRKRKRNIGNIRYDAKCEKFETVVDSELDASPANAANDLGHDIVECLDGSPTPTANDYNHDSKPDTFRCLSCFSLFIPTANGFKLFRIFGEKSEDENMQNRPSTLAASTNRFFSIFARKVVIEQENDHRQQVEEPDVGELNPSHNLNGTLPDQNGHAPPIQTPLLVQSFSVGRLVQDATTEAREAGKDIVASKGGPIVLEKMVVNEPEKTDDAMKKSNAGGAALDHSEVNAVKQLKSSSFSDDMLPHHESDHPVTPLAGSTLVNSGEPAEDAILKPQQDGLKILVPSTAGSLMLEKSQRGIDQKPNMAIERISAGTYPFEFSVDSSPKEGVDVHEGEPLKGDRDALIPLIQDALLLPDKEGNIGKDLKPMPVETSAGKDVILLVEAGPVEPIASQREQNIIVSAETGSLPQSETRVGEQEGTEANEVHEWDILKSIVYGGLIESITSLGVVLSAAGADAATLNVFALGLANLIGGLFVIGHDLRELNKDRSGGASDQIHEQLDRYQETLGRRENLVLHSIVAILSYLIFGLVPPVIYGFSFLKSDNRELKIAAVVATSLLCIIILAIGKCHVRKPPKSYFKTVLYYVSIGLATSGISYIVGNLIKRLLEKLGWFESSVMVTMPLPEVRSTKPAWGSY